MIAFQRSRGTGLIHEGEAWDPSIRGITSAGVKNCSFESAGESSLDFRGVWKFVGDLRGLHAAHQEKGYRRVLSNPYIVIRHPMIP